MKKHYYWLDLIRFLAAFEILLAHYRGAFFVEYGLLPHQQQNLLTSTFYFFSRLGEESVLLFFVLSGFLVGGKSLERILNNTVDIKSYSIDRFVRIILPLIASVILVIIIDLIIGEKIPLFDITGSLLSLQGIFTTCYNNPPLWSLSYEIWFYVLMGCMMAICRNRDRKILIASFLILAIVFLIFTKLQPIYLFIWLMGTFAYLLPQSNKPVSKLKLFLLAGLLFGAIVLSQLSSHSRYIAQGNFQFLNKSFLSIFIAFISCLFIHTIIHCAPEKKLAIKIHEAGSKLSKFSYSLYLTHYPVIYLLSYYGFPKSSSINIKSVSLCLFAILIALLIGYLVYMLSEKHTNAVKKILRERKLFTAGK